ncbi:MAG: hypothetical protein Kow0069_10060 [Promethearchaeota archaeon]
MTHVAEFAPTPVMATVIVHENEGVHYSELRAAAELEGLRSGLFWGLLTAFLGALALVVEVMAARARRASFLR